jgi:hypothetical protein
LLEEELREDSPFVYTALDYTKNVEKVKELLNELIEREFTIDEMAELFGDVRNYLSALKESQRKEEDESYRQVHAESVPRYRKWLQQTLDALGLDYTIEEFEEEF